MKLRETSLDDKYAAAAGRVYLTGTQALVRLALDQRRRDRAHGLRTAGFVSGYRGSPLGAVDREFQRAHPFAAAEDIRFRPGVNEDLAATAIWGSQQAGLAGDATVDGVFALWYGKGPGVDRSGDVFRHANLAGTAPLGGVLAIAGDDPGCKSSTVPSQCEQAFADAQIPVLAPAGVQEILDFGLAGWAMSRFTGLWVALKTVADLVDSAAIVEVDPGRVRIKLPGDWAPPAGGLSIRWPDPVADQEVRLHRHKMEAALAFARANALDRVVYDAPAARLGIAAAGKAFLDVMQALADLGIDEAAAARIGLRVYKVGMAWPLEPEGARRFARGLDEILVVEEKRAVIEPQLKEHLYDAAAGARPRIVGKFDEAGDWILPSAGELSPARVARVIAARLARFHTAPAIEARIAFLDARDQAVAETPAAAARVPYFCAGCPHNTSTVVPEGSRAVAGIGCHYLALAMDRSTATFTHMGGEGANWIGLAPFTAAGHVFVNLGDGTYFHSGLLAIRAAVAAGVNITYKILYNDAVAMTGGQPVDGPLDVPMITRQVAAEGVAAIAVVGEDVARHPVAAFAPGVTVHDRDGLDRVQRRLAAHPGVSVLVYDQTCAAEKRRRRKRGRMPDPPRRAFINEAVCEGCGDCGRVSNCVAIVPLETELGRKRAVDQSVCNKDFSCIKGFCPSFVTVHGANPRRRAAGAMPGDDPPPPAIPAATPPYGILVTGIGGTGVVTVGALLGIAAHMEGKAVTVLDQTGLAQKNGAVVSHVRIADDARLLHAARLTTGGADLLLGCDIVTAGAADSLEKLRSGASRAVVNSHATMTADFTRDPDLAFPADALQAAIGRAAGPGRAEFVDAGTLATALMGDSLAVNLFMVGLAFQKGLVPLTADAIGRAIEINGARVEFNRQAFAWGRRAAHDPAAVAAAAGVTAAEATAPASLDELVARRIDDLTRYQDAAYARRYADLVGRVRRAEAGCAGGRHGLAEAVAGSYHKLLAYKDEYEVARLYADGAFERRLAERFEGDVRLTFHLAPPLFAPRDPATGAPAKIEFGPWMMGAFRLLARLRRLRGTPFDPFGRTVERRLERRLIADYETTVAEILERLDAGNHAACVAIARIPERIRGFGHVKRRAIDAARAEEAALLARLRAPAPARTAAE